MPFSMVLKRRRAVVAAALVGHAAATGWEPLEHNQLYVGGDLHTTSQSSIHGCAEDCRAFPKCDRFVWTPKVGGTCYLKESTTVTAPAQHGAMAGRLTPPSDPASSSSRIEEHQVGQSPLPHLTFCTMNHAMWASAYPTELFTVNLTDGNALFRPPLLDSNDDNITPFHHVETIGECAQITSVFEVVFFTYLPTSRLCIPLQFPPSSNMSSSTTTNTLHLRHPSSNETEATTLTPLVPPSFLAPFQRATGTAESVDACNAACAVDPSCAATTWGRGQCTMYSPNEAPAHVDAFAGWLAAPAAPTADLATSSNDTTTAEFRASSVHFFIQAHPDDALLFMMDDALAALMDPTAKIVFVCITAGDAGQEDGWWEAREAGAVAASAFLVNTLTSPSTPEHVEENIAERDGFPVHHVTVGPRVVHYFLRLSEAGWNGLVIDEAPTTSSHGGSPVLAPSKPHNPATSNDSSLEEPLQLNDIRAILRSIIKTDAYGIANASVGLQAWPQTPAQADDEADHELHIATGKFVAEQVVNAEPLWKTCINQRYYFGYQRWRHPETMHEPFRTYQRQMWMHMSKAVEDRYPVGYPPWLDHAHTLGRQYVDLNIVSTKPCHS